MIEIPDLIILIGYFLAMIWVGVFFTRRMKNIGQFFGGGKRIPWWLASVSFYMATFSAFALIIYSEMAYRHGVVALTLFWMAVPASLLTGVFFATRWRRAVKTSALEFTQDRYGTLMRQGLAWLNIPLRVIDSGLKLLSIGLLITGAIGLGPEWVKWAILFSGLAVFIYTFLGGLWGVMVADFVQAIIIFFAAIVLLPLAMIQAGGFEGLTAAVPDGFFNLTTETYSIPYLLAWLVILTLNYSTGWALVQRFYSVDSDLSARKVAFGVAVLHTLTPPILFGPALFARVFLPDLPEEEIARVYALVVRDLLPLGLIGLTLAAMFAATMSMLAGEYNAMASVLTNDVYKGVVKKDGDPKHYLYVGRFNTLAVGLCSMGIAFLVLNRPEGKSIFDVMMDAFALFLPPMAIPILAGLCSRKVTNRGGLVGLISGITAGIIVYILGRLEQFDLLSRNFVVVPTTVGCSVIGMIIGTIVFPSTEESQRKITAFFEKMDRPPEPAGKVKTSAASTPLYVTGACLLFLGSLSLITVLFWITHEKVWLSASVFAAMTLVGLGLFLYNRKGLAEDDKQNTADAEAEARLEAAGAHKVDETSSKDEKQDEEEEDNK